MKAKDLKNAEMRARYVARLLKGVKGTYKPALKQTTPLFVAGWQRSGTTMLMNIFHLHPDIEVYNEAYNSKVFTDFRIRNIEILTNTVKQSRFPVACYKIICDSHILDTFVEAFPEAKLIWMYRSAADNAESHIRKFPHATRAIKLVAQNQPGGGWFAEGVGSEIAKRVRDIAKKDLTEFDYACLAWWVRNSLYFDLGLEKASSVRVLQYEQLVKNPREIMKNVFDWVGLSWNEKVFKYVHSGSVGKPNLPSIDPEVAELCNGLKEKLDQELIKDWK